jgi:hypothetical protein
VSDGPNVCPSITVKGFSFMNRSRVRYDVRMKSKLDPTTTPAQKMNIFGNALRQILTVSKEEYRQREKQYQAESTSRPKRGPKPKTSTSGHVSDSGD